MLLYLVLVTPERRHGPIDKAAVPVVNGPLIGDMGPIDNAAVPGVNDPLVGDMGPIENAVVPDVSDP